MQDTLLRVDNLKVAYGALVALDQVSWSVGASEILGIIGPNGAGKSSCYNAVTNLVPHQGTTIFDGKDISSLPASNLSSLGLKRAFQQNAFFSDFTVLENMVAVIQDDHGSPLLEAIFLPARRNAKLRRAEVEARQLLIRFGVPEEFHRLKPTKIPYGTQRMLSIALAFGSNARVLLLDEPAAGLGGADMQRLVSLLTDLKKEGVGLVVIEHHMDLIMSVADRIVVIDQGKQLATGKPAEIQSNEAVLEAYLGRDGEH
jgi:branched-chain amino acid transport system ATP-binding protein